LEEAMRNPGNTAFVETLRSRGRLKPAADASVVSIRDWRGEAAPLVDALGVGDDGEPIWPGDEEAAAVAEPDDAPDAAPPAPAAAADYAVPEEVTEEGELPPIPAAAAALLAGVQREEALAGKARMRAEGADRVAQERARKAARLQEEARAVEAHALAALPLGGGATAAPPRRATAPPARAGPSRAPPVAPAAAAVLWREVAGFAAGGPAALAQLAVQRRGAAASDFSAALSRLVLPSGVVSSLDGVDEADAGRFTYALNSALGLGDFQSSQHALYSKAVKQDAFVGRPRALIPLVHAVLVCELIAQRRLGPAAAAAPAAPPEMIPPGA